MTICILHGYLLEGSGSNLWTRSIVQSLCRDGETVHLVCQENHPERYDFIANVERYHADGSVETTLQRAVPYKGRCIMHKPYIGETLPVYVWDHYEEFPDVQPMVAMSDEAIEDYLTNNVTAVTRVVAENSVSVLHANHAVLMSVVARRVSENISIPFAIMPHGSAIEYAVKKDPRFLAFARESFSKAQRIYVIGTELRQRIKSVFLGMEGMESKIVDLPLGVDTALFQPVSRKDRTGAIESLCEQIRNAPRGKTVAMSNGLCRGLSPDIKLSQLMALIKEHSQYEFKSPDDDVESRLRSINWQEDQVLLFVGRLISSKGLHLILAALPGILKDYPRAKLVVVGHGPLREPLEALLWALKNGASELVRNIVKWGSALEATGDRPLKEIQYYFDKLEATGQLEAYFESAQKCISDTNVIFTGYLTHQELRYLFPACDVAIFPSVVAEAGPLVFLEAMASGCFPLGTYFAGMAASIDSVEEVLPTGVSKWMKLSAGEKETVHDMVLKVRGALGVEATHKAALHRISVEKYDWQNISKRLARDLHGLK